MSTAPLYFDNSLNFSFSEIIGVYFVVSVDSLRFQLISSSFSIHQFHPQLIRHLHNFFSSRKKVFNVKISSFYFQTKKNVLKFSNRLLFKFSSRAQKINWRRNKWSCRESARFFTKCNESDVIIENERKLGKCKLFSLTHVFSSQLEKRVFISWEFCSLTRWWTDVSIELCMN